MNLHLKLENGRARPVKVWRFRTIFESGRSSIMIWSAFTGFDKCPLVIIPPDRRKGRDFVDEVYENRLSGFYFLHDHPEILILMEDGALVHHSKESSN